jgi:tetratricopeptide (TPR) repeat protein
MNNERHNSIYNNLAIKSTEELLSIWQDEEDLSWEEIVYEFIEQILQERLDEIPPRSKSLHAQELLKKSKEAFDHGDTDQAMDYCGQALELNPKLGMVYHMRGMIHEGLEEFDQALADYRKAAKLDPRLKEAQSAVYDLETYLESLIVVEEFTEELARAVDLAYDQQFDEALQICNAILEDHPNLSNAYNDRGVIYDEMGEKEKSLADYQKALQLDPTNQDARDNLASLSRELDNTFEDSDYKARLDNALEYIYEEEFDVALEICRNIKPDLPALAIAHNYYGLLMESMGQVSEAVDAYQRAVEINPTFSAGFDNLRNARWKQEAETYHRAGLENITCDPADAEMEFRVEDGYVEDESLLEDLPGWFYMDEQAFLLPGWPGYRNRPGRFGLDQLDNEFESGYIQGVIISKLLKGKMRTKNPIFLLLLSFFAVIFCFPLLFIFDLSTYLVMVIALLPFFALYCYLGFLVILTIIKSLFDEVPQEAIDRGDAFY